MMFDLVGRKKFLIFVPSALLLHTEFNMSQLFCPLVFYFFTDCVHADSTVVIYVLRWLIYVQVVATPLSYKRINSTAIFVFPNASCSKLKIAYKLQNKIKNIMAMLAIENVLK